MRKLKITKPLCSCSLVVCLVDDRLERERWNYFFCAICQQHREIKRLRETAKTNRSQNNRLQISLKAIAKGTHVKTQREREREPGTSGRAQTNHLFGLPTFFGSLTSGSNSSFLSCSLSLSLYFCFYFKTTYTHKAANHSTRCACLVFQFYFDLYFFDFNSKFSKASLKKDNEF